MRTELITPPAEEPVTLAEAKTHLRVDHDDDDDRITRLIATGREACETLARRAFVTQTWELHLDRFPASAGYFSREVRRGGPGFLDWLPRPGRGEITVPRPPLVSVTSITYLDQAGDAIVLDDSAYRVLAGTPGRIVPAHGSTWPSALDAADALVVRYVAGYGDADSLPSCVKDATLLAVERLYDGAPEGSLPTFVKHVLGPVAWGNYR